MVGISPRIIGRFWDKAVDIGNAEKLIMICEYGWIMIVKSLKTEARTLKRCRDIYEHLWSFKSEL